MNPYTGLSGRHAEYPKDETHRGKIETHQPPASQYAGAASHFKV